MFRYTINANKKVGIRANDPVIFDKRGLFYKKKGAAYFNLPPGQYFTNQFPTIAAPIKYKLPSLPMREKLFNTSDNAKVHFYTGKGPLGMVSVAHDEIYLNTELLNKTTPQIMCVLFHELGHYLYKTEYKCDLYAINKMLKIGYNPSQFAGFLSILSNRSINRKVMLTEHAKKVKAG